MSVDGDITVQSLEDRSTKNCSSGSGSISSKIGILGQIILPTAVNLTSSFTTGSKSGGPVTWYSSDIQLNLLKQEP